MENKNNKINKNEKFVQAINDLYILNRWKYLILSKDGVYFTKQYYKNNEENKDKPLTDWILYQHLAEKETLGVFAGKKDNKEVSKFICFDVDIKNSDHAKWVSYKICNTLQDININDFYVSSSGNKGYHIEIFFTEPIETSKLYTFYLYVLNTSETLNLQEYDIKGEVEFRPTYQQGVKIPLGRNFRNKKENNKCWYVDWTKSMKHIESYNYILKIKKIDSILFEMKIDELIDIENIEIHKDNQKSYTYIKEEYTPLEIYKHNVDEEITIETIQELEKTGLNRPSTRHNALLKISKYYKYLGMNEEDNKNALLEWMAWQDQQYYSSTLEEIEKDISSIVRYIYTHNCSITGGVKNVNVSYEEIKEVMKAKSKNEKLVLYAFLIHSKRYATVTGLFYFPISKIIEATHLTNPTICKIINSLNNNKFIDIIERNKAIFNNNIFVTKAPNKYKLNIHIENKKENIFKVLNNNDYVKSFNECILKYFDKKEIKQLCGRRHYEELMRYKDNIA